jgi:hypothetical protein
VKYAAPLCDHGVCDRAGRLVERMNLTARTLFAPKQRGYVARWDQLDITDEGRNSARGPCRTCSGGPSGRPSRSDAPNRRRSGKAAGRGIQ